MVTDHIKNADLYLGLSDRIGQALTYLKNTDLEAMAIGRYELDGDDLFVLIQEYEPKAIPAGKCEAHKNYIDIQYIISGSELMGYGRVDTMEVTEAYDKAKDRLFVAWDGNLVNYTEDMFAIFYPQDAHMPGISDGDCNKVKKAVVKIRL